jgi:hypothetical protein
MSDRRACGDVVRRYRRVPQAAQCPWAVMRGFARLEPNRVAERTGESNAEFLSAAIDSALRQSIISRYSATATGFVAAPTGKRTWGQVGSAACALSYSDL